MTTTISMHFVYNSTIKYSTRNESWNRFNQEFGPKIDYFIQKIKNTFNSHKMNHLVEELTQNIIKTCDLCLKKDKIKY
jgi:hypothetical protein